MLHCQVQPCRQVPEGCAYVTEGTATVLQQGNSVFYNKAQVVNRDLSIAVLQWFINERQQNPPKPSRHQRTTMPPDTPLQVLGALHAH